MSVVGSDEAAVRVDLVELLVKARLSREVVQATGKWVERQWTAAGFSWVRSRKSWERHRGERREQVELSSSYRNRAGKRTKVWVAGLAVHDDQVKEWRERHPELSAKRPEGLAGLACTTSFLDLTSRYWVELSQPESRLSRVGAWAEHVAEIAFPWFASTIDPARLAETVPDRLVKGRAQHLVELAVSRGELDQARLLIERALAVGPLVRGSFEEGRELARRGGRADWQAPHALGWSSLVLDLM
ncbi:hypothetical protein [Actinocorallia populi]|uniref:hypothetical protein n=1 Tax=Actinocorallia populi TaxID=2079200 RepID=UPI001300755E|nr:hypothetical protein [Actinocorallia populi]